MGNKVLRNADAGGISVSAVAAALLGKGDLVKLDANGLSLCGANETYFGTVTVPNKIAGGKATAQTPFKQHLKLRVAADVVEGQDVKMAAASGGVQRVTPWVSGTDAVERRFARCLVGALAGADGEFLTY